MFISTSKYIFAQQNGEAVLATQSMRMSHAGKHYAEPVYDQGGMGTDYVIFPSVAEAQRYAGEDIKVQFLDYSPSEIAGMKRLRYVDLGDRQTVVPWRLDSL